MASKKTSSIALFLVLSLVLSFHQGNSHFTGDKVPAASCPVDALKLGVCVNVLNGLVKAKIGKPPTEPCCAIIRGLVAAEVGACLCTTVKLSLLDIVRLNVPLSLSLLVDACSAHVPPGWKCA